MGEPFRALLSAYFAVVLQTRRGEKREASGHISGLSRGRKAECHARTWTNLRGCAKKQLVVSVSVAGREERD